MSAQIAIVRRQGASPSVDCWHLGEYHRWACM